MSEDLLREYVSAALRGSEMDEVLALGDLKKIYDKGKAKGHAVGDALFYKHHLPLAAYTATPEVLKKSIKEFFYGPNSKEAREQRRVDLQRDIDLKEREILDNDDELKKATTDKEQAKLKAEKIRLSAELEKMRLAERETYRLFNHINELDSMSRKLKYELRPNVVGKRHSRVLMVLGASKTPDSPLDVPASVEGVVKVFQADADHPAVIKFFEALTQEFKMRATITADDVRWLQRETKADIDKLSGLIK